MLYGLLHDVWKICLIDWKSDATTGPEWRLYRGIFVPLSYYDDNTDSTFIVKFELFYVFLWKLLWKSII